MTEIISVMSLAEMGFGTAIVYHLYKPLAENDTRAINRYMGLYRKAYRVIFLVFLAIGACVVPFVPKLVTGGSFSNGYVRLIFVLFLAQTASSYLFSYKGSLFNADQKYYIVTLFNIAFNVATALFSVLALTLTKNYIVFLCVQIVMTLALNASLSFYADKKYPYLRQKAEEVFPEERKEIFSNIKHLFIGKISGKITSSTDNILISVLVSTYQIGIYTNYAMLSNAVVGLFRKVSAGATGSMGNMYVTVSHNRAQIAFNRLEFMFGVSSLAVTIVMYSCLSPFVRLWLGDGLVIDENTLFVCMINQYLFIAREPLWNMVTATGMFSVDKYISILGSSINLIVSIILGKFMGMLGIFIGTTCTLVIQVVLKQFLLYKRQLEMSPWKGFSGWLGRTALFIAGMLAVRFIGERVTIDNLILNVALRLIVCGIATLIIVIAIYSRTSEFKYCMGMVMSKLPKRFAKRSEKD